MTPFKRNTFDHHAALSGTKQCISIPQDALTDRLIMPFVYLWSPSVSCFLEVQVRSAFLLLNAGPHRKSMDGLDFTRL